MSRNLPKGAPLPKAPFAAGVAIMGGMFYAVLLDAKGRQPDTLDTPAAEQGGANTLSVDADTSSSVPSSTVTAKTKSKTGALFLGGYEEVCAPTAEACAPHRYTCMCMCTACTRHTPCQVSAANVPSYVLASTNLDNEQKLQARSGPPRVHCCTSTAHTPAALHPHLKSTCSVHLYTADPPQVIYTADALHVHDTCTAGALYVHCMCTA